MGNQTRRQDYPQRMRQDSKKVQRKLRVNKWAVPLIAIFMLIGRVHLELGNSFSFGPVLSYGTTTIIALGALVCLALFNAMYNTRREPVQLPHE